MKPLPRPALIDEHGAPVPSRAVTGNRDLTKSSRFRNAAALLRAMPVARGFTLIELVVTVAIVAILALGLLKGIGQRLTRALEFFRCEGRR